MSQNDPTTASDTISVLVRDETPSRGYPLSQVVPVALVAFILGLAVLVFLGSTV